MVKSSVIARVYKTLCIVTEENMEQLCQIAADKMIKDAKSKVDGNVPDAWFGMLKTRLEKLIQNAVDNKRFIGLDGNVADPYATPIDFADTDPCARSSANANDDILPNCSIWISQISVYNNNDKCWVIGMAAQMSIEEPHSNYRMRRRRKDGSNISYVVE